MRVNELNTLVASMADLPIRISRADGSNVHPYSVVVSSTLDGEGHDMRVLLVDSDERGALGVCALVALLAQEEPDAEIVVETARAGPHDPWVGLISDTRAEHVDGFVQLFSED